MCSLNWNGKVQRKIWLDELFHIDQMNNKYNFVQIHVHVHLNVCTPSTPSKDLLLLNTTLSFAQTLDVSLVQFQHKTTILEFARTKLKKIYVSSHNNTCIHVVVSRSR